MGLCMMSRATPALGSVAVSRAASPTHSAEQPPACFPEAATFQTVAYLS